MKDVLHDAELINIFIADYLSSLASGLHLEDMP